MGELPPPSGRDLMSSGQGELSGERSRSSCPIIFRCHHPTHRPLGHFCPLPIDRVLTPWVHPVFSEEAFLPLRRSLLPWGLCPPHEDTPKDGSGEQPWRQRGTPPPAHMQAGLPPALGSEPTPVHLPHSLLLCLGAGGVYICPKALRDSFAAEKPSVCLLGKSLQRITNAL